MTGKHRPALRAFLALGLPVALSGCDLISVACTDALAPSVVVEVRDAVNGMPAARGVTGVSEHESGVLTDLYAIDDLRLRGGWSASSPDTTRSSSASPDTCRMSFMPTSTPTDATWRPKP